MKSVITAQLCCCSTKDIKLNVCACLPITLKSEFHTMFMCHRILFFNHCKRKTIPLKDQKQVAGWT